MQATENQQRLPQVPTRSGGRPGNGGEKGGGEEDMEGDEEYGGEEDEVDSMEALDRSWSLRSGDSGGVQGRDAGRRGGRSGGGGDRHAFIDGEDEVVQERSDSEGRLGGAWWGDEGGLGTAGSLEVYTHIHTQTHIDTHTHRSYTHIFAYFTGTDCRQMCKKGSSQCGYKGKEVDEQGRVCGVGRTVGIGC